MTVATDHVYIERDDAILGGEPIIKGTRTPVRAIVELWRNGMAGRLLLLLNRVTAEEMEDQILYV